MAGFYYGILCVVMNRLRKKIMRSFLTVIFCSFLMFPVFVNAQDDNIQIPPPGSGVESSENLQESAGLPKLKNPLGEAGIDSLDDLLNEMLKIVLMIGVPVVALFIIWSGFLFVSAQGNSEKLGKAKSTLMYSLIGAGIVLGASTLSEAIVGTITGIINGT
jgi:hypothetical protein